jgi:hypothetical protein
MAYFDLIDDEEKAYWLGFIYADGNVGKNGKTVQVNLSQRDSDHLEKLAKIFKVNVCNYSYTDKRNGRKRRGSIIYTMNGDLWNSLIKCGVIPQKTYVGDVSVMVNSIPKNLIRHFVRGFLDGDGWFTETITKSGKRVGMVGFCGTEEMMKAIRSLVCDTLGLSHVKIDKKEGCYTLRWSGSEQVNAMSKWLYSDSTLYLQRKKEKADIASVIKKVRGVSGYRGVVWYKNAKKWSAYISHEKKRLNLGYFEDVVDAAKAFDRKLIELGKPRYRLNFPQDSY